MSTELSKTYAPAAVETEALRVWKEENLFHAEPSDPGEPYCICIPPPNVTGALHLGHAINNTLQDILIRAHRMMGFNTVWIPGLDHAGIATQAVVEKQLKEKENKTRHDIGREALVKRIWEWKQQYGDRILEQLRLIGCSCDWQRARFTLDDQCARAVRETFFKLFKDGLIYRGKRLVNWDVLLQTSISDDEIYHENVKTNLWHIKYEIVNDEVVGGGSGVGGREEGNSPPTHDLRPTTHATHMVVATTRPETLLGDTAVAVHSEDPRWNWAIGKQVRLPLLGRLIPIIADDILVDPKFGTGVVKVTPAHDPNDYAVWQRHQGKADAIEIINLLNPDGTLNENAGPYAGMKRDAARKKVVEDLVTQGLLVKEEPYETQVGHSDRSKTPVEPYLSDQWFVKMAPLAEPALQVVRDGTIKFHPERHAQQYLSWLGEKRDWPISRQLWWGHRIPVWRKRFDRSAANEAGRFFCSEAFDASMSGLGAVLVTRVGNWSSLEWDEATASYIVKDDEWDSGVDVFICPRGIFKQSEAFEQKLVAAGFIQDPDVLDTWFSSALWPHSTLGWPEQTASLAKWYPGNVLLTDRGIITLWVARMVMTGMYNMGQPSPSSPSPGTPGEGRGEGGFSGSSENVNSNANAPHPGPLPGYRERGEENEARRARQLGIPFRDVVINPTILDGKGERMSKSKGNGVDPVDIIESHGADALRFTLTHMATETQDVRMPVKKLPTGKNTSDKFDLGRNFCNKLWNAARFVLSNLETANAFTPKPQATPADQSAWSIFDRWILGRLTTTLKEVESALNSYRFDAYAKACYDFFWRDLCDWYVEAIKPAMKDPARAPQTSVVLAAALDGALRIMHPVLPFITETIFWKLNEVRPERTIPGVIELTPGKRLIKAAWPKATSDFAGGFIGGDVERIVSVLQEIIGTIRNLRNEHQVDLKRVLTVSIKPGDAEIMRHIAAEREVIELLATCSLKAVDPNLAAITDAAKSTAGGCEIFIEGLVDADAEKQRVGKRREELSKSIVALKGRLSNEAYLAKAPPNLVQQTKDQLAAAEKEFASLGCG